MNYTNIFYVLASVLFILGIKKLSHPKTARSGNFLSACGMFVAIISTLIANDNIDLDTLCDYPILLKKALETEYISEKNLETLSAWNKDPENWN